MTTLRALTGTVSPVFGLRPGRELFSRIVKPHVLRYWEQEFPQLQPVKRRGNRRYYQRHEVELIRTIRRLLYIEGYTISGASHQLAGPERPSTDSALSASDVNELVIELEKISTLLTAN